MSYSKKAVAHLVILIAGLISLSVSADGSLRGSILNGIGARAMAMGGAFTALADDATAAFWNPAGLAQLDDTRLVGVSTDLYGLGITHQFVGATTSFANLGIGLGWKRASIDGQAVEAGGVLGGSFTWVENAIIGSLATNVMGVA
ncbi:hypothetical protein ACFLSG_03600, partial [Candidatus Bipolaricaulota bacterium]